MRFCDCHLVLSYVQENRHAVMTNFNVIMANVLEGGTSAILIMIVEITVMNQEQTELYAVC